jgi:hypothetical protein
MAENLTDKKIKKNIMLRNNWETSNRTAKDIEMSLKHIITLSILLSNVLVIKLREIRSMIRRKLS